MSGIHLYFRLYGVSFSHLRQISLFSKKKSSTLFSYEMFLTGEFVCVVEVGDVVINYCLIFYFQLLEPLFYVIKFNNQRKLFIENSRNRSNTLKFNDLMISKNKLGKSWPYSSWTYNCLCNQCLLLLKLWARIPLLARRIPCNLMR